MFTPFGPNNVWYQRRSVIICLVASSLTVLASALSCLRELVEVNFFICYKMTHFSLPENCSQRRTLTPSLSTTLVQGELGSSGSACVVLTQQEPLPECYRRKSGDMELPSLLVLVLLVSAVAQAVKARAYLEPHVVDPRP